MHDGGGGDEDDGGGGDVAEDLDSKSFEVLLCSACRLAEAEMQRLPSWQRRTGSAMYR